MLATVNAARLQTIAGITGLAEGNCLVTVRCPILAQPRAAGKPETTVPPGETRPAPAMLEQPSLLVRPWNPAPPGRGGGQIRLICDAAGAPVGFARQVGVRAPRWLHWLGPRALEVYETPDGSLVFALRRGWGWPNGWRLVDADEGLVGTVRGRVLLDGFGHHLAVIDSADPAAGGRFLALHGRELGEYVTGPDGCRLTFAAAVEGNPFARMLLLGAVLARE